MPKASRKRTSRVFRPYKRRALGKRQARAVATIAKKQIRKTSEWKHHTSTVSASVDSAGSVFDLSTVAQGDTDTSRDGDTIFASSVIIRGFITTQDTFNRFRVIFVQWKAPVITIADVLIVTAGHEVDSMYNTDKAQQYKIMFDRTYTLNPNYSGGVRTHQLINKLRFSSRRMQFSAGTLTGNNKLYMICISDSSVAAHPTIDLVTKLNFRDG